LEISGKIPMKNEKIIFDDYTFIIESADKRKINRVKVILPAINQEDENNSGNSLPDKAGLFSTLFIVSISFFLTSCNPEYTPKPKGYFRIDFPKKEYQHFSSTCPFSFDYPVYATMIPYQGKQDQTCWYNLDFKGMRATLHLSYLPLNNNLPDELRDSLELVYKHTVKADAIEEEAIVEKEKRVFGLLYHLSGNTASAKQFYLTDSSKHFVRGALYFNCPTNSDSLAPVVNFLTADIYQLLKSFRWQ
jgi:gliding motility-associated lipoprotein GldD